MSVYKKLASARVMLQSTSMKKSGINTFSHYQYFELEDFMPHINSIFNEVGLCGIVSFTTEIATLTIFDTESDQNIVITSPMAEAQLKGCHPVQNLGAVETYQRRYLWVTALEIVEHDPISESDYVVKEVDLTDFQSALESATDLKNLRDIWDTIPKEHQKALKAKASEVKVKLEKQ